jgi:DNA ligase-1
VGFTRRWDRLQRHIAEEAAAARRSPGGSSRPARTPASGAPVWQPVVQHRAGDAEALRAALEAVVARGGEGLMLRHPDAPYAGGRSPWMRKFKPRHDAEAQVLAHLPGRGRHAGRLGALVVRTPAGVRFRIGTGFSDADRIHPPALGEWVTYTHQGLTAGGVPRFASFLRVRPDRL